MTNEERIEILKRFCAHRNNVQPCEVEIVSKIKITYDPVVRQNQYIFTRRINSCDKEIHVSENVLWLVKNILMADEL